MAITKSNISSDFKKYRGGANSAAPFICENKFCENEGDIYSISSYNKRDLQVVLCNDCVNFYNKFDESQGSHNVYQRIKEYIEQMYGRNISSSVRTDSSLDSSAQPMSSRTGYGNIYASSSFTDRLNTLREIVEPVETSRDQVQRYEDRLNTLRGREFIETSRAQMINGVTLSTMIVDDMRETNEYINAYFNEYTGQTGPMITGGRSAGIEEESYETATRG